MQASADVDARVILRGMRPKDKMVNQTGAAAYKIGGKIRPLPKVSMDDRLFKIFGITRVPAMVYRKGNHVVSVNGVTTLNWFLEKARKSTKTENLGVISKTYDIIERPIQDVIRERASKIDWEKKRSKALKRYIAKLPSFEIPSAQKDALYKIDPRIKFTKDAKAKDGTLLAAKGQVVNPVGEEHFPGRRESLFIFDGTSPRQTALVHREIKKASGKVHLITSRIDKEKGFKSIIEMRKDFLQPVYMLQQRFINRFQIKHLPVQIMLGSGEILVREYGMQSQTDALQKSNAAKFQKASAAEQPTE